MVKYSNVTTGLSNVYQKYPMVKRLTFTSRNEDEVYKLTHHHPSVENLFYRVSQYLIYKINVLIKIMEKNNYNIEF